MIKSYLENREAGETSSAYYNSNFLTSRPCQKDVRGHTGCVNSITLSQNEQYLASGGDDLEVYIWQVNEMMLDRSPKPKAIMNHTHESNIFATEFSNDNMVVYSGGRDEVVLKHDVETGRLLIRDTVDTFHENTVHSIKQCRTDDNMLAITRSGIVVTCDSRCNDKLVICRNYRDGFHNGEFNPATSYLFLTCSLEKGPLIYDLRNLKQPMEEDRLKFYGDRFFSYFESYKRTTYASWSPSGNSLATLNSKQCPNYFDLNARVNHICRDEMYVNSKTMKSMTFLDERTIVTGSDEGTIFIWNIPEFDNISEPHEYLFYFKDLSTEQQYFQKQTINRSTNKLKGHRSIPNQIRFCESSNLIISSGVENSIKLWSMETLPYSYDEPFVRRKRSEYQDLFGEVDREKEERRIYEESLGEGAMDGRATWEDVFGGNLRTTESRSTCEMFDVAEMNVSDNEDDDDDVIVVRPPFFRRIIRNDSTSENGSDESDNNDIDWDAIPRHLEAIRQQNRLLRSFIFDFPYFNDLFESDEEEEEEDEDEDDIDRDAEGGYDVHDEDVDGDDEREDEDEEDDVENDEIDNNMETDEETDRELSEFENDDDDESNDVSAEEDNLEPEVLGNMALRVDDVDDIQEE